MTEALKPQKNSEKSFRKPKLKTIIPLETDAPKRYPHQPAIFARTALQVLLFIYFLAILKLTLFRRPINYFMEQLHDNYSLNSIKQNILHSNILPFSTIAHYFSPTERLEYAIPNLLGNFVLFMPFGFILPIMNSRYNKLSKIALVTLILSLSIEIIQMIGCLGYFDIDDLLLNTLGAITGFWILVFFRNFFSTKTTIPKF